MKTKNKVSLAFGGVPPQYSFNTSRIKINQNEMLGHKCFLKGGIYGN